MTTNEMARALSLVQLAGGEGEREVSGCYIGDLLSWVMSRVTEGNAWITVMGNINAIAVARLADISAIILCENASLDAEAKARADSIGIPVYTSSDPAYELAMKLSKLLVRPTKNR